MTDYPDELDDLSRQELLRIQSRIFHVHGRLTRMAYSKTISKELPTFVRKTNDLIDILHKWLTENVKEMSEALENFENLNLELPEEEDSEYDEGEVDVNQYVKSKKAEKKLKFPLHLLHHQDYKQILMKQTLIILK